MSRTAVLAVALLLVLAGCGGFSGDGATDADATTLPEETTVESTDDPPPGLSESGVTDAAALAAAHEAALVDRSYTYDREVRIVAENGTELGRWHQRAQVGADRAEFNYSQTGEGVSVSGRTVESVRVYANGSVTLWDEDPESDDGGEFRRESGPGFAETTFSNDRLLADVLNASETSVEAVERDGRTWYRVEAADEGGTYAYDGPNGTVEVEATNVTATALVAPSGLVRNLTYEFDFVRGETSGRRTMEIRYSELGATAVEVPAWVADAKRATDAADEG